MKILLFFIYSSFVFINYVQSHKLTCNEITTDTSVEDFDVEFYLNNCKSKKPKNKRNLKNYLKKCGYRPDQTTFVLIHGFNSDHEEDWLTQMKKALKNYNSSTNVIRVNWDDAFDPADSLKPCKQSASNLLDEIENFFDNVITKIISALAPNYRDAALSTEITAKKISNFIQKIASARSDLHFIGHSLGAHVAGQAARNLKSVGINVRRVTGLDPAYPCFGANAELRLRKDDAQFVDVIHSNSKLNSKGENPNFGTREALGHIDFYPNGGYEQPGCKKKNNLAEDVIEATISDYASDEKFQSCLNNVLKIDATLLIDNLLESDYDLACDHSMAPTYFIESLNKTKNMLATPFTNTNKTMLVRSQNACNRNTCTEMGINAHLYKNKGGIYYLSIVSEEDDDDDDYDYYDYGLDLDY